MPDAATLAALKNSVDANWDKEVAWLQTLVRFPSLRGREAPCQDWIAREFAGRGWSVDRYTLDQVAMDHLPGFAPVMDTEYSRAVQVVATVRAAAPAGRTPPESTPRPITTATAAANRAAVAEPKVAPSSVSLKRR
jgi:hypothetical protein